MAKTATFNLNIQKFGISMGLTFAILLVVITILASTPYGLNKILLDYIAIVYPGYSSEPIGIIIGIFWAFVNGLIFGTLLAYLYNFQL